MSHLNDDTLLLLAYGELGEPEQRDAEAHLAACEPCRARLHRLERARVASEWAAPLARRLSRGWVAAIGLAAAAVLAAVYFMRAGTSVDEPGRGWSPPTAWSATAGYIAGGATVVQIDAQLTRLEQERYHVIPD
jgi:hypothetical protein